MAKLNASVLKGQFLFRVFWFILKFIMFCIARLYEPTVMHTKRMKQRKAAEKKKKSNSKITGLF